MVTFSTFIRDEMAACILRYDVIFAFSQQQFEEKALSWETYVQCSSGALVPKRYAEDYVAGCQKIQDDGKKRYMETYTKEQIIMAELVNHESFYVGDYTEAFEAVEWFGFSVDDVREVYVKNYAQAAENW